jgi:hypothetical protein
VDWQHDVAELPKAHSFVFIRIVSREYQTRIFSKPKTLETKLKLVKIDFVGCGLGKVEEST